MSLLSTLAAVSQQPCSLLTEKEKACILASQEQEWKPLEADTFLSGWVVICVEGCVWKGQKTLGGQGFEVMHTDSNLTALGQSRNSNSSVGKRVD